MVAAICLLAVTFTLYVRAEKQIDKANEVRQLSLSLADELRQSSDDLTRMVRSYVLTGDLVYKQQYLEVLDIRDGKVGRPQEYERVYWDLVTPNGVRPRPTGEKSPILVRLKQTGFTELEMSKMAEAKSNSDKLAKIELVAMSKVDTLPPPRSDERLRVALTLNDATYNHAKMAIMKSIDDFYVFADRRTKKAVEVAIERAILIRVLVICIGLMLLYLIWRVHQGLNLILGGPIHEVYEDIELLGKGDFSKPVTVGDEQGESVLGWLSKAQSKLAKIDHQRRDAIENAVAANLAKSQFLATMSHEIRTPLNGILGMAQLLMMDGLNDSKRKEFAHTILGSGQSLLTILNDILDLSKIEAGKMELTSAAFDPVELVSETAALFNETAHKKGLAVFAITTGVDTRYMGDAIRLRQMISNYVGNAIKFSEHGEIVIGVKEFVRTEIDCSQTMLEFSVTDSGIGISADKQAALFQPFSQVDGSATRRFGGTGLGLSIVRKLAEQMGGTVGVESREGRGSRFWFSVPCERMALKEDVSHHHRFAEPSSVDDKTKWQSDNKWALVVEDNAINRMVVQAMLEQLGLAVRMAEDGQQALAMLANYAAAPPNLILMDCQMPIMDGYETTKQIRRIEIANGLPRKCIVALTAAAFEEDQKRCAEAGME